jgi:cell division protein FtsI (penicillin-binding protein 3)
VNVKKNILLRARLAFLAVLLFAIAILAKTVILQWVEGDQWRQLAEKSIFKYRKVNATRGNIFADEGSLLATSLPFYKLAFDPTVCKEEVFKEKIDSLSLLLSSNFGIYSSEQYKRRILDARLSGRKYLSLSKKMIDYQAKKRISAWPIFNEGQMRGGVIFEKADRRFKPFNVLGERTIGYVNENNKGAGLEYSFNKILAGQDGEALFRKMSGGSWRPVYNGGDVKVKHGYDIHTTININIQDVAEASLMAHLEEHRADKGCVILMEVQTGEIKAMANLQKMKTGRYGETYNYAVGNQGLCEPGSTFKLASLMALLEEGGFDVDDSINAGDGTYYYYDNARPMTDAKPEGYGVLSGRQGFEKSSNIAISRMVYEKFSKNPERFIDYLNAFGLSEPLGFQIVGEAVPNIKTPEDPTWSGLSLPWMSIGYELELAPIHTLAFYNAVANDGKMIQPVIVKEVRKADKTVQVFESNVIRKKICSEKTLEVLKALLEGVVQRGTARNIKNSNYRIAGKTGTAQKLKNGRYIKQYYTSFAGYFPAEAPKYSCIVVIDNPKGFRQYATDVAAPVFKDIADKIYALDLNMHDEVLKERNYQAGHFPLVQSGNYQDLNYLCNKLGVSNHYKGEEEVEWVRAGTVQSSIRWRSVDSNPELVPDVRGMTLKDALYLMERRGLKVLFSGNGRVKEQSFHPGTKALRGSTIEIKLAG